MRSSGSFSSTARRRDTGGRGGGSGSRAAGEPATRCSGQKSSSSSRKGRVTHIGFARRLSAKAAATGRGGAAPGAPRTARRRRARAARRAVHSTSLRSATHATDSTWSGWTAKSGATSGAPPGGPGHGAQDERRAAPRSRRGAATFTRWWAGRRHAEELHVEHVREPGERVPVGDVERGEGPGDPLPGQARRCTARVLGDVAVVVEEDEGVAGDARVERERREREGERHSGGRGARQATRVALGAHAASIPGTAPRRAGGRPGAVPPGA